ncbi:DUF6492 family protein [Arvimicrobium flavum]|uniref:DUF6492 family protein n=1 Tax=Arvimicrobium flavum TaxID=3393320 RepID=UPI00237B95FD|nr:DUF6492 family protein [Mesorhizobium shangrilense]
MSTESLTRTASTPARRPTSAIVTPSYAPDFERCRLLCETLDHFVTGFDKHYLLVEQRDVSLFRALESPRRVVISERDLLPRWLVPIDDPLSGFKRRLWLSPFTMPLRGWHVQQLRRMAIAMASTEDVLVYCDSDVVFLKPFDCAAFHRDDKVRLYRNKDALLKPQIADQRAWSDNAARVLGIPVEPISNDDYITTVIAWRRATMVALCEHLEKVSGRNWVAAAGTRRKFSECMIYGRFVDDVLAGQDHFHDDREFCHVKWFGDPMSDEQLADFVATMAPEQVAIGMQSFIGTDLGRIRRLTGLV